MIKLFFRVLLLGHTGDGGVKKIQVALGVEMTWLGLAADAVEPALQIGIGADDAGVGLKSGIRAGKNGLT